MVDPKVRIARPSITAVLPVHTVVQVRPASLDLLIAPPVAELPAANTVDFDVHTTPT